MTVHVHGVELLGIRFLIGSCFHPLKHFLGYVPRQYWQQQVFLHTHILDLMIVCTTCFCCSFNKFLNLWHWSNNWYETQERWCVKFCAGHLVKNVNLTPETFLMFFCYFLKRTVMWSLGTWLQITIVFWCSYHNELNQSSALWLDGCTQLSKLLFLWHFGIEVVSGDHVTT